jgi:hypothetical protein
MEVLTGLTESLKAENEDGFGYRGEALWVVDAATPLTPGTIDRRSPAAWLRERVCELLVDAPWQAPSLRQTLAWLIERLAVERRSAGLCSGSAFPTAAVALVRRRATFLDLCLLGDLIVVVREVGGTATTFVDPQFDGAERAIVATVADRLAAGEAADDVYRATYDGLRARRRDRNTSGGVWILSDVATAAEHAHLSTVDVAAGSDVLVASDGFARALEPFAIVPDASALLDEVAAGRAYDLLRTLRAAEAADPECVRFPRFGVSDDATAVHVRL